MTVFARISGSRRCAIAVLALASAFMGCMNTTASAAAVAQPVAGRETLQIFVRAGCPHCEAAKDFVPQVTKARPDIRVVLRSVDDDPRARDDLIRYSREAGIWLPGVPAAG